MLLPHLLANTYCLLSGAPCLIIHIPYNLLSWYQLVTTWLKMLTTRSMNICLLTVIPNYILIILIWLNAVHLSNSCVSSPLMANLSSANTEIISFLSPLHIHHIIPLIPPCICRTIVSTQSSRKMPILFSLHHLVILSQMAHYYHL